MSLRRGVGWYILTIGLVSILYALGVDRYVAASIVEFLFMGFAAAPLLVDRESQGALGLVRIPWRVGVLAFLITSAAAFAYNRLSVGEPALPKIDVRLLCTIVLAPVAEELFFRGYLQRAMRVETGKWAGLLITTVLFTAAHLPKLLILREDSPLTLIVIFVLGAGFGIVRDKTGSIYPSMLCHGAANIASVFFVSIPSG